MLHTQFQKRKILWHVVIVDFYTKQTKCHIFYASRIPIEATDLNCCQSTSKRCHSHNLTPLLVMPNPWWSADNWFGRHNTDRFGLIKIINLMLYYVPNKRTSRSVSSGWRRLTSTVSPLRNYKAPNSLQLDLHKRGLVGFLTIHNDGDYSC